MPFNSDLANRRDLCAHYPVSLKTPNLFPSSVTKRFFLTSAVVMPYSPELLVIIHIESTVTPPTPRVRLYFGIGLFIYLCLGEEIRPLYLVCHKDFVLLPGIVLEALQCQHVGQSVFCYRQRRMLH